MMFFLFILLGLASIVARTLHHLPFFKYAERVSLQGLLYFCFEVQFCPVGKTDLVEDLLACAVVEIILGNTLRLSEARELVPETGGHTQVITRHGADAPPPVGFGTGLVCQIDKDHILAFQFLLHGTHLSDAPLARSAPCCPEVDEDHLAGKHGGNGVEEQLGRGVGHDEQMGIGSGFPCAAPDETNTAKVVAKVKLGRVGWEGFEMENERIRLAGVDVVLSLDERLLALDEQRTLLARLVDGGYQRVALHFSSHIRGDAAAALEGIALACGLNPGVGAAPSAKVAVYIDMHYCCRVAQFHPHGFNHLALLLVVGGVHDHSRLCLCGDGRHKDTH